MKTQRSSITVTLDTTLLGHRKLTELKPQMVGLPIDWCYTTVNLRETNYPPKAEVLVEPWVLGESRLGESRLGRSGDTEILNRLVQIISDNSFPKAEKRSRQPLEPGYQNQLRDAIILQTHLHEQRDIFLTDNTRDFKGKEATKLKALKKVAYVEYRHKLRVMTLEEFSRFCARMKKLRARQVAD